MCHTNLYSLKIVFKLNVKSLLLDKLFVAVNTYIALLY